MIQLPDFGGDSASDSVTYILPDTSSAYRVSSSQQQPLHMDIDYGDSLMIADASEGSAVEFYPDYRISVTGSNMDYSVKIVMDNGLSEASDWHTLTVSGSRTDKVRLEKTDSGFVLKGTSKNLPFCFSAKRKKAMCGDSPHTPPLKT